MESNKAIRINTAQHNSVSKTYNYIHSEIFNNFEQTRVDKLIKNLCSSINKDKEMISVMDLGSGTGNLTLKFLKECCCVTATDVSARMLQRIYQSCPIEFKDQLKTAILSSETLPFADNTFDIVATYSVLHHVPDYIRSVKEMIRVTKPGGYIYIDHEFNENYWNPNILLREYYELTRDTWPELILAAVKHGRVMEHLKYFFIKTFINKKYTLEGDLHISKDDHVEWDTIEKIMMNANCEIITKSSFLMYRPKGGMEMYQKYNRQNNDTTSLIARKK